MSNYLISFLSSAMDHIPQKDFAAVSEAAHAVLREAKLAGVWVFGGCDLLPTCRISLMI